MRLAIVIGVTENRPPYNSLAACGNDARIMASVLKETGRFDDIIQFSSPDTTKSQSVKDGLSQFVSFYKGKDIEEVFLYYSGHGDFSENEFYYILSDYNSSMKNQTSLQNSELDVMIRSISPKLFVKIVDSCYSGVDYIKSGDILEEYLKSSKSRFKDIYFLYSSQSDEQSWTDGDLSAFTRSLLLPLMQRDSGQVRYRDLMSAASDHFTNAGRQKPRFVTQADFTETFCEASASLQALLAPWFPSDLVPSKPATPAKNKRSPALLDLIKAAEEKVCTREDALKALETFREVVAKDASPEILADVFEWKVVATSDEPSDSAHIGDWLSKNSDKEFFARPTFGFEKYKKRVRKGNFGFLSNYRSIFDPRASDYEIIEDTRKVINGYVNTASLPFDKIIMRLEPRFKVINPIECLIIPLLSSTSTRVFWSHRNFIRTDWDSTAPAESVANWHSDEVGLKNVDGIEGLGHRIANGLIAAAKRDLGARWPEAATKEPFLEKPADAAV